MQDHRKLFQSLKLGHIHSYYYQVQGVCAITVVLGVAFVVCTLNGMSAEWSFDTAFWADIKLKIVPFQCKVLLQELALLQ